jgi:hypothetical protein
MQSVVSRRVLLACVLGAAAGVAAPANALVGRPWTPLSAAGVARRTTRRVVRRTATYAASLPHGCVPVTINGGMLYQCGPTYYQPTGGQYVLVQVQ